MKPSTSDGYDPATTLQAKATCLYVATKLGDLMDEIVVVGGLVPSLLVPQDVGVHLDAHIGTMDVDLALNVELLSTGLYERVAERLRGAGFALDTNDRGNAMRQRWRPDLAYPGVGVDFLVQPTRSGDKGGRLRNLKPDFAAVIVPGLHLAFQDLVSVGLSGMTIQGERATRKVRVCGPGAFIVLKALAFRNRGEEKDAYDLYYVLRYYGSGVDDVVKPLRPLAHDVDVLSALAILREDFLDPEGLGPHRAAGFLNGGQRDDDIQADVAGFVGQFVRHLDAVVVGHGR
ncbi:MAG: hypothetical protein OXH09_23855 [Gammaproteobacteria bacterium]|nr:hypothetical protein [Gammaproteobacteria bacterium]